MFIRELSSELITHLSNEPLFKQKLNSDIKSGEVFFAIRKNRKDNYRIWTFYLFKNCPRAIIHLLFPLIDIKKHSTLAGAGFPYIKQIPDNMEIIYVESARPDGPFGASGVGEMPLTCPHAAVINGIYNACGARVRNLPALPEKVLAAMPK